MTRARRDYPYEDGDMIVLGPEVFATKDRSVISWQGENYVRRHRPTPGPNVLNLRSSAQAKSGVVPIPKIPKGG